MEMKSLTIGQVAKKTGIGVETIRFYEREGLLENPPRNESGYRQYAPDSVARINFIRHAKELGFSLREIQELLSLRLDNASRCEDVRRLAELKLADIETKIHSLERMRDTLGKLVDTCVVNGHTYECPILEALEPEAGG